MTRLISGKIKKTPSANADPNRYSWLDLQNAEPDLGVPASNGSLFVSSTTGTRSWTDTITIAGAVATINTLTVTGNSNLGSNSNIKITGGTPGQFLITDGTDNLFWSSAAISNASGISNDQSSVVMAVPNGNIAMSVAGTSNVVVVSSAGAIVTGNVSVNGTITAANITANTGIFTGNGSGLSAITGANVTGTVPSATSATTAGTVTTAAQPNITSVGTLTSLAVTGNVSASNLVTGGEINSAGNITAPFFFGNLVGNISGNIVVPGSNGEVLFNNEGNTGTSNAFSFNRASNVLTVNGNIGANFFNGNGSGLSSIAGANVTGEVAFAATANAVAGANVSGTVANATFATTAGSTTTTGTVTTNAQPNITSVGTLTGLGVNGNITAANITANTGVFTGNGSGLSAIAGANVTGTVSSATTAGTVTTNAQPNITSVGTLTSLGVSGTVTASAFTANTGVFTGNGNGLTNIVGANVTGTVANATFATSAGTAGTVTTAAQPNITSIGTLSNLNVSGNTVISGNLTVDGNLVYVNVETLSVEDPIIQLQTGANGSAPSANSGKDVGTALNYYDTQARVAFMGWDVSNVEFGLASQASITNEVVTFTSYGNLRVGNIIGNGQALTALAGANVTGEVAFAATANAVAGANVSGTVANATFATTAGSATTAGTVTTNAQPNITSVGTLTGLTVGNATANTIFGNGTVNATGNISALTFFGNLVGNISGNIVVPGSNTEVLYNNVGNAGASNAFTFNSDSNVLTVVGNVSATNFIGNGSSLTALNASNVSSGTLAQARLANSNVILGSTTLALGTTTTTIAGLSSVTSTTFVGELTGAATTAGSVTTNAQGNITSVGTLTGLGVNGTITAANITANTGIFTGNGSGLSAITGANVTGAVAFATTANAVAGANVSGTVSSATTAGTVTTNAQPNITSVGTLSSLAVTANANVGNLYSTASVQGATLAANTSTGTPPLTVISTTRVANLNVAYANVADFINVTAPGSGTVYLIGANATTGNVAEYTSSGITMNLSNNAVTATTFVGALSGAATTAGTVTTNAQPNITSVGTLTGLTVGNATANTIFGNGTINSAGNITAPFVFANVVGNISGNFAVTGSNGEVIFNREGNAGSSNGFTFNNTSNALSVNGTITAPAFTANTGIFTGNGSGLSAIAGANVTGTVSSATTATTAGTVTTAAQPNITSVGTLSSLTVTGTATAGNLTTGGVVTATGNVSGGNLTTSGVLSVTGTGVSSIAGNLDMTSNNIINLATPVNSTDAATKQYVDDVAQGLHTHDSCNAATQTTLATISGGTVTYNNGTSGVGATLTTTGSYTTIDGVTLSNGMRILVKDEANTAHNGIYDRTSTTVLTRSSDFDTPAEMAGGDFTFVSAGTLYDNTGWVMPDAVTTVGTTAVVWVQFSGAGTYTAGTGLTLTGSQFSVNASQTQVTSVGTLTGLIVGNSTANTTFGNGIVTATGNITAPFFLGNVIGNISGNIVVPGSNTEVLYNNEGNAGASNAFTFNATSNALSVNGLVTATSFTANTGAFTGSGANLTTLNASNISSGTLNQARLANSSLTVNGIAISLGGSGTITANTTQTLSNGTYITGSSFNGGTARTWAVDATTTNTANKVVARDADGSFSANIITATLSGSATSAGTATTAGTVTTNAQPNITSVGTLTGLTVGNSTANTVFGNGTINSAGNITAPFVFANVVGNISGNFAVTGSNGEVIFNKEGNAGSSNGFTFNNTSNALSVNGLVTATAFTANTGAFTGSGANLTTLNASNISSGTLAQARLANSNVILGSTTLALGTTTTTIAGLSSVTSTTFVGALTGAATSAGTAGTVTTNAQPNITSVGTLTGLTVGNATANIIFGNGTVNATGNLTAPFFLGNVIGNISGNFAVTGSNGEVIFNKEGNAGSSNGFTFNNTSNALTVTGNANVLNLGTGRVIATGNISGTQLISNIAVGTAPLVVTSTTRVANLNVANAGFADAATTAGTVTTNAQPNITSVGTLTGLTVGNATANTVFGNGTINAAGNITAPFFLGNVIGNISGNFAVTGSNTEVIFNKEGNAGSSNAFTFNNATNALSITGTINASGNANVLNLGTTRVIATGNISATQLISNIATGTAPLVVTSTTQVANLNAATAGTAGSATTAGTVTTNAQPNITSVGTLSGLTVGNATANTVFGNGTINAAGNITAPFVFANVVGNISGNFAVTGSNGEVIFNKEGNAGSSNGFIFNNTTNALSVTGTITGGNLDTAGVVTATGNVTTSANLVTNLIVGRTTGITITAAGANTNITLAPTGTGTVDVSSKRITNLATPSATTDAATKAYVDSVAEGLTVKAACRAATTGTLALATGGTITYDNGAAGVGATLTVSGGTYTAIDGVTLTNGDRVLVKNEATAANNGIYVRTSTTVLTRATDFDNTPSGEVAGAFTFITNGTVNGDAGFVCTTNNPVVMGTTAITFTQFSGAGTYTAGTGLVLNGSVFSIDNTAVTPASYGGSDVVGTFTVNQQGQLTAAANVVIQANAGNLSGTVLKSTVVTSSLTTVGTLGNLAVTSNITSGNANLGNAVRANFFIGDGSGLTNIPIGTSLTNGTSSVTIPVANGNVNTSVAGNANILVVTGTGANVTGTFNATGNANVLNLGTIRVVATGNITAANANLGNLVTANFFAGDGSQLTNIPIGTSLANGTSSVAIPAANGNVNTIIAGTTRIAATTTGAIVTGTLGVTANVTSPQLISNVAVGTAPLVVTSTTRVANLNVATAGVANTVNDAAQTNITSVGTLTSLAVTGNITSGNATLGNAAIANYFIGDGSQLTGVPGGQAIINGTSNVAIPVSNGNVNISVGGSSNRLVVTTSGANITGTLGVSGNANVGNLGTARVIATGNISGTQLISNVATGTAPLTVASTTQVANLNAATAGAVQGNFNTISTIYLAGMDIGSNGFGSLNLVTGIQANFAQNSITATTFLGNLTGAGNTNVGNLNATGYVIRSVGTGISAAGTVQGNATAITKEMNVVSTVASGAGVVLPTAVSGMVISITNTSANTLLVYPATSAAINTGATNAAYSQPAGATLQYLAPTTAQWYTVGATFA
jgi:hypothetical protein